MTQEENIKKNLGPPHRGSGLTGSKEMRGGFQESMLVPEAESSVFAHPL